MYDNHIVQTYQTLGALRVKAMARNLKDVTVEEYQNGSPNTTRYTKMLAGNVLESIVWLRNEHRGDRARFKHCWGCFKNMWRESLKTKDRQQSVNWRMPQGYAPEWQEIGLNLWMLAEVHNRIYRLDIDRYKKQAILNEIAAIEAQHGDNKWKSEILRSVYDTYGAMWRKVYRLGQLRRMASFMLTLLMAVLWLTELALNNIPVILLIADQTGANLFQQHIYYDSIDVVVVNSDAVTKDAAQFQQLLQATGPSFDDTIIPTIALEALAVAISLAEESNYTQYTVIKSTTEFEINDLQNQLVQSWILGMLGIIIDALDLGRFWKKEWGALRTLSLI